MGTSTTMQNSTVTQEPPRWQSPYMQQGLQYAQNLLDAGAPQYYSGSTVTPFSRPTEQALAGVQQRATAGSPVTRSAQNYVQSVLSGNGSAQAPPNPYLDQMFNQAAMQSRNVLESEFARSGRNLNAAVPLRGQQLNNLATQIYGGAYDADRNRGQAQQIAALAYANPLANQDYADLAQLRGAGSELEDLTSRYQQDAQRRWDYEQQAPSVLLDQYLARTGTPLGQSSVSSDPLYRNTGAGAIGGAAAGAGLAGQLSMGGNWPLILAGLGGLLGGL